MCKCCQGLLFQGGQFLWHGGDLRQDARRPPGGCPVASGQGDRLPAVAGNLEDWAQLRQASVAGERGRLAQEPGKHGAEQYR